MVAIKRTKIIVKYIYLDKPADWKDWRYYMVQVEKNSKDKITKISEFVSKDLKNWTLIGRPYTYTYLKNEGYLGIKLEEIYSYMYNKHLSKLDIYDIIESKEVEYLRG